MGKKGRRARRNFNLRKVRINGALSLGALAALDVISGAITSTVSDKLRFISVNASYSWSDFGALADDGCVFGLAHSDYSTAEIEECLEANTAMDLGDKVAQERANRLVREIGTIGSNAAGSLSGEAFADGRKVKTRLNWLMSEGDSLSIWVRNASNTVWTTGSSITMAGEIWVKD